MRPKLNCLLTLFSFDQTGCYDFVSWGRTMITVQIVQCALSVTNKNFVALWKGSVFISYIGCMRQNLQNFTNIFAVVLVASGTFINNSYSKIDVKEKKLNFLKLNYMIQPFREAMFGVSVCWWNVHPLVLHLQSEWQLVSRFHTLSNSLWWAQWFEYFCSHRFCASRKA